MGSYDLSVGSVSRGVILYNGDKPVFTQTDKGFKWSFGNEQNNYTWNDIIPNSKRFGNDDYILDLYIDFMQKN